MRCSFWGVIWIICASSERCSERPRFLGGNTQGVVDAVVKKLTLRTLVASNAKRGCARLLLAYSPTVSNREMLCSASSSRKDRFERRGVRLHKPSMMVGVRRWAKIRANILKTDSNNDPLSAVGLNGGRDTWSVVHKSRDEIEKIAEEACSTIVERPIIAQYYPGRSWLWAQWRGTVIRRTLPREVSLNVLIALVIALLSQMPTQASYGLFVENYLAGVARAWTLCASMATFILTFFLSQSYTLWRKVYDTTRRIQARLNDLGLLCATFAERDPITGRYSEGAEEFLARAARYIRLFHILYYASVTSRYASLRLPKGLDALVKEGVLTAEERDGLNQSSMYHDAVMGWLSVLFDRAIGDGRLSSSVARSTGSSPLAVQMQLERLLVELRATSAGMKDQLVARMPLAYVQLVQVLTDGLMFFTPFALIHSTGPVGVVLGTAVVTLFYSSIVILAKLFLDPFNNEIEKRGGDVGIGGIRVDTLLAETNIGSEGWRKSVASLPDAVWHKQIPSPRADAQSDHDKNIRSILEDV